MEGVDNVRNEGGNRLVQSLAGRHLGLGVYQAARVRRCAWRANGFFGRQGRPEDTDIVFTARRETWEEIGVKDEQYDIVGALTPVYIPPSKFLVQPFVAIAKETLTFVPDSREVEYVWQIPVNDLLSEKAVSVSDFKTPYGTIKDYPCYVFGNHIVWGATAMMTAEIRALLSRVA